MGCAIAAVVVIDIIAGEFNIWDTDRHELDEEGRSLHSVTALKVDSTGSCMFTGNSLGYIQVCKAQEALLDIQVCT